MDEALEIVGVVALVISGFLLAPWIGFGLVGVGCLLLSFVRTTRRRHAAEKLLARQRAAQL